LWDVAVAMLAALAIAPVHRVDALALAAILATGFVPDQVPVQEPETQPSIGLVREVPARKVLNPTYVALARGANRVENVGAVQL